MENVNAVMVLLEHHSVAQILMSVRIKFVIKVQFVKIHRVPLNVFAPNKLLAIRTQIQAAFHQINVYATKIVLETWHVSKENVQNLVRLPNVDETPSVRRMNTKHSVYVHQEILAIQLIRLMDVSVLNVSPARIAVQPNSAIHKSTNAKVNYNFICVSLRLSVQLQ